MFGSSLGKFRVTGWWEEGASVLVAYISVAFARREGGAPFRIGSARWVRQPMPAVLTDVHSPMFINPVVQQ